MWRKLASTFLFLVIGTLIFACEAVTHANDYGTNTASTEIDNCGNGTLSCNGSCVREDATNCSACGVGCAAGLLCSNGTCGSQCTGGTTQCGSACVDLQNDPANCGQCGGSPDAGACPICQDGQCRTTCLGGKDIVFCAKDKKCIDTSSNAQDCGGCAPPGGDGVVCAAGAVCSSGKCTSSCGEDETQCGSSCYNLSTDPNHCNSCDAVACPGPTLGGAAVCIPNVTGGGTCGVACNVNLTYCVGTGTDKKVTCADLQDDPTNCGTCGHSCVNGGLGLCHQGVCSGN